MTLWLTRAGSHGEGETLALEKNLAVIGWEGMPDLTTLPDRESLKVALAEAYPDSSPGKLSNWAGQLHTFARQIQTGDLVALPLKSRSAVVIGRVEGDYQYRTDLGPQFQHVRPVTWLKEFARTEFDQDLLYSLGAFMTVCQIKRGDAEARVNAMLKGTKPPTPSPITTPTDEDAPQEVDLEQYGRDQISAYILQRFKGHGMARLLEGILKAQGYTVYRSPEGADGGIDLLAGQGVLGFGSPRLGVQVKSSEGPADVKVVRELQGVLRDFGADQGLFLSWGGFNKSAYAEARKRFFNIRLWDAKDFVDALLSVYDQLDPELQAELPLKRVWTLVSETQDG